MMHSVMLLLLFTLSLSARENPFFPAKGGTDLPLTTNQQVQIQTLERASLTLPSTARILQSVTIKYKNLDGSISEKTEEIGEGIDWHLPLFVSQNIDIKSSEKSNKKKSTPKEKERKILNLSFISLVARGKNLDLHTKDRMIRTFLLVKPQRIVCDFARDIDIRSRSVDVKKESIVTQVRVGNHDGYYRVVIELDGYYKYEKKRTAMGYNFKFL